MECVIYMGAEDMRRQALNVYRMRLCGAEVRGVEAGQKTLKEAINEAMRDWVTNVRSTYYVLGSALGSATWQNLRCPRRRAALRGRGRARSCPDATACCGTGKSRLHRGVFARRRACCARSLNTRILARNRFYRLMRGLQWVALESALSRAAGRGGGEIQERPTCRNLRRGGS